MYIVFVATWSCRVLIDNSGDGGSEGDECNGDVIDSCDSGDFAGGFGGHDGLRVMKDFNETFPQALDAFKVSAVICILHVQRKLAMWEGYLQNSFTRILSYICTFFKE